MEEISFGGIARKRKQEDLHLGSFLVPDYPLKSNNDWSSIPVEMQSKIPACGSHAGAFFRDAQETIEKKKTQRFSPRFSWIDIKSFDGFPLSAGTSMDAIFKSLEKAGACDFELIGNDTSLSLEEYSNGAVITDDMRKDASTRLVSSPAYTFSPTIDQIKTAIDQYKVVIALVNIHDSWYTSKSGISSWLEKDILPLRTGNFLGRHFVVLHNYDEKYIYFRNSWSESWCRKGDGYFDSSYIPNVIEIGTAVDLNDRFVFNKNLCFGMQNDDVKQLQLRLGVVCTGFFGYLTLKAVIAYQKAKGISPSIGFVWPLTRAELNK